MQYIIKLRLTVLSAILWFETYIERLISINNLNKADFEKWRKTSFKIYLPEIVFINFNIFKKNKIWILTQFPTVTGGYKHIVYHNFLKDVHNQFLLQKQYM